MHLHFTHSTFISHLDSSLLVGLLLHLQLDCEDFGLPTSLTSCSSLGQGGQLASLKHQLASRELTQHQSSWGLGLLLLSPLGCLNLLNLCDLLLGRYPLTCCRGSLGGLLENQGDPFCFSALETDSMCEIKSRGDQPKYKHSASPAVVL